MTKITNPSPKRAPDDPHKQVSLTRANGNRSPFFCREPKTNVMCGRAWSRTQRPHPKSGSGTQKSAHSDQIKAKKPRVQTSANHEKMRLGDACSSDKTCS